MNTNCLITKLDAVVTNPELPRLNAATITFGKEEGNTEEWHAYFTANGTTGTIISGDAVFTNSAGTSDDGTVKENMSGEVHIKYTEPSVMLLTNLHLLTYFSTQGLFGTNAASIAKRKYVTYDLAQILQGNPTLNRFSPGQPTDASNDVSARCTGDVSELEINAPLIFLGGCDKIRGSIDHIIETMPVTDPTTGTYNKPQVSFYSTRLSFNSRCLEGKYNLYVYSNRYVSGNIKWFGDTLNKGLAHSTPGSNLYTGSVEELVQRLVMGGRTGEDDFFGFRLISGNTKCYTKITLHRGGDDYIANMLEDTTTPNIVFTWEVKSTLPIVPGTGEMVITNPATGLDEILLHAPTFRSGTLTPKGF